jgi:hypothetical protein
MNTINTFKNQNQSNHYRQLIIICLNTFKKQLYCPTCAKIRKNPLFSKL